MGGEGGGGVTSAQRSCCHPSALPLQPQPLLFQSIHPDGSLLQAAQQPCDLHLWKTYGHSALPAEPGGQSCRVAYVTQTSQTPGGDERQSGSFARSTLSARLTPVFHVEVRPRWPWETTAPRETVAEKPRARRPCWLKPDQSHGSSFSPEPLPWLGLAWPLKL